MSLGQFGGSRFDEFAGPDEPATPALGDGPNLVIGTDHGQVPRTGGSIDHSDYHIVGGTAVAGINDLHRGWGGKGRGRIAGQGIKNDSDLLATVLG